VDVNGDDHATPLDALLVINYINSRSGAVAESEPSAWPFPAVLPEAAPSRARTNAGWEDAVRVSLLDLQESDLWPIADDFDFRALRAEEQIRVPSADLAWSDELEDALGDLLPDVWHGLLARR
jgi:hypothetical protein